MSIQPPVCIMHVPGTNRDRDAAWACERAGGAPEIVLLDALLRGERELLDFQFLLLPGGFSFGDDLGAGRAWGAQMMNPARAFRDRLEAFIETGRPVLGICNGFQALIRAGLLPGDDLAGDASLVHNASGRFECRWVTLDPDPESACVFTRALEEPIQCPVAHGEGRFVCSDETLATLRARGMTALRYRVPGEDAYPHNPNGSVDHIAGICNARGNVLGLMPHPEDHILPPQHPHFHRGGGGGLGLRLFEAGVRYAAQC